MEQEEGAEGLSKSVSALTCLAMAFLYVAILYAPALILRLPPPSSLKDFMVRRFVCAVISSTISLVFTALILPIRGGDASEVFRVYGIRLDHTWQAVVFPLSLTSLMYAGSLVLKSLSVLDSWKEHCSGDGFCLSFDLAKSAVQSFFARMASAVYDVLAWRNCVVAPLTEELVFRACMIPLLLCGGFKIHNVVFLCPILFSLAHLNHWMEIYIRHHHNFLRASVVVGLQLSYTVIFGLYASFLFIRTGHFIAPLVAHIFCNFMGLPVLFARRKGMVVSMAFLAGVMAFGWLLFPITRPDLYNDRTNNCRCWQGYCSWNCMS